MQIYKQAAASVLGITLEPSSHVDGSVVIAAMQDGYGAANSGQLRLGDVIHQINGEAIASPDQAGRRLQAAQGAVRIALTRENAKPKNGWVTPWTAGRSCIAKPCAAAAARGNAVSLGGAISGAV